MRTFEFASDCMGSTEDTCNLKVNFIIRMHKAPPDERITADLSSKKRPEGKQVRAMEIVLELISFVLASKKTWQHNIFYTPIPFRGGPSMDLMI